jgi:hypothetical protein
MSSMPELMIVGFSYPAACRGYGNGIIHVSLSVDEDAEEVALSFVEHGVEQILADLGMRFIHEYSWPDGSCYKAIEVSGSEDETWAKLCSHPAWKLGPVHPLERYAVRHREQVEEAHDAWWRERTERAWRAKYGQA